MPITLVTLDGQHHYPAAYVAEHTWNGFLIPAFDTLTAQRIMADVNAMHDGYPDAETFTYDPTTDTFTMSADYGQGIEHAPVATTITREGARLHFMGDSWTWQHI